MEIGKTYRVGASNSYELRSLEFQGVAESVGRSKSAIFGRDKVSYENPRIPSASASATQAEYFATCQEHSALCEEHAVLIGKTIDGFGGAGNQEPYFKLTFDNGATMWNDWDTTYIQFTTASPP